MPTSEIIPKIPLASIANDLERLPVHLVGRVAELHVRYLDNRIDKIASLSKYLRGIDTENLLKASYIDKVNNALFDPNLSISDYTNWYTSEYSKVNSRVNGMCDQILNILSGDLSAQDLIEYWREFSYWNEIDNFHGMFLTSGRWNVNFMLPAIRGLISEFMASTGFALSTEECALLTQYLITPEFAERKDWNNTIVRHASAHLQAVLRTFDSEFMFLYSGEYHARRPVGGTVSEFAVSVRTQPEHWMDLLNIGVFPPFAWHELHGRARIQGGLDPVAPQLSGEYIECLRALKALELHYHLYNYKGRFGLLSKPLYLYTAQKLRPDVRRKFMSYILMDRFSPAAQIVERGIL